MSLSGMEDINVKFFLNVTPCISLRGSKISETLFLSPPPHFPSWPWKMEAVDIFEMWINYTASYRWRSYFWNPPRWELQAPREFCSNILRGREDIVKPFQREEYPRQNALSIWKDDRSVRFDELNESIRVFASKKYILTRCRQFPDRTLMSSCCCLQA
jgi:hypothetical protein